MPKAGSGYEQIDTPLFRLESQANKIVISRMKRSWLYGGLVAGLLAASPTAAASFSGLVVFGDSLSDTGNAGRFTNGPVWVESVAEALGLDLRPALVGGTNYAVGGARAQGGVIDILSQTKRFLAQREADPDALYVVFGGANDLLASACDADDQGVAREAAAAIGSAIERLTKAGAVHVLVPNLPDIGRAPVVRAQGAGCVGTARALTRVYNAALDRVLMEAEREGGVRLLRLDAFALAEGLFADPQKAGFRDVTTPCRNERCEGILFWDHLHPTAEAHSLLARHALRVLETRSP